MEEEKMSNNNFQSSTDFFEMMQEVEEAEERMEAVYERFQEEDALADFQFDFSSIEF
jgi:hypothetical protein